MLGHRLYDGDVEWARSYADGNDSTVDWPAAHHSVHCIFVNEESYPMFMLVILPTVVELMSFISRCFPLVLPSCFT